MRRFWGSRLGLVLTVCFPAFVLAVLYLRGTAGAVQVLTVLVGLGAVLVCSVVPGPALLVLLAFLPLQQVLLALLLRVGMPVSVVRSLGSVKEVVAAGLVIAAFRSRTHRRFDLLDRLALGYVGLVTVYLVLPSVAHGVFVDLPLNVRALAWRSDALFAVLFLAARRVVLPRDFGVRAGRVVVSVAALVSVCALIELLNPKLWSNFLINGVHLRYYRAVIFGVYARPTDELNHILVGGTDVVRVGSVLLSPLTLGFVLLLPLAICLESIASGRWRSPMAVVGVLVGAALAATLTRSAILGGVVVAAVTLRMGVKRLAPGRVGLGVVFVVTVVLLAPLAGASTVGERTLSTFGGDQSTAAHQQSFFQAIAAIARQPFGRGLGTAPGIGDRFAVSAKVTSENAYLQVGAELGIITMLVFVALMVVLLVTLWQAAADVPARSSFATVLLCAGAGLAVGGFFLHVWLDFPTALPFWALAGVALAGRSEGGQPSVPRIVAATRTGGG